MTVDCNNTSWIDSASKIHVFYTMQNFQNQKKLVGKEQYIYFGKKMVHMWRP